ncbi:probable G-protein coupled receptor 146 [Scyliorhinus canicula]|uniref:probable G-protein coupled receptor 146 n=1 Tax=Scyliorhinus canicula TaxID=7830 RepID=UPI0018F6A4A0|nr:probable G-protein coupled receptor 146 [Scyliorhinus canicula]XP_038675314.1 probable G-protein coupled receptor 146 [Scyliorhinus canicula]XP_038675315.1 probable G-protein coupled receptor 146 [Scyliorhinus canicula]XP_038675316.1 probable G-protein coupled receptor 146 [Scyliorhinus canicula]XP_038675317.1 probable G-protein coupled receptor 146 [Scyliorhinus canicula]XP_038675318.1 probable G-protein coupled receptor 146 [Scyliorhinus canicula]XP_038675319.1 probable G-protein coupled
MWSCGGSNGTVNGVEQQFCDDLGLVFSILSIIYLIICFPFSICYNSLLVLVNLYNKPAMTMPDVYFVNIGIAGLILSFVALVQLLGPDNPQWAVWNFNREVYITLLILFNISALVIMYSTTLLSLDYYIEQALPRTYMSSVYNTKHVCGFVWGGAVLTSFSSLLLYVCSHVPKIIECSKIQNKEVADAIMVFIGFFVPATAVFYALILIFRIRNQSTPLDQDSDPSTHKLLVATICTQFILWTPYYMTLLVHIVFNPKGSDLITQYHIYYFVKGLSKLLAYSCSFVIPLLYTYMHKNFTNKLRQLVRKLDCRTEGCSHQNSEVQQQVFLS